MDKGYNLKRVHRFSLIAIYGVSIIFIIQNLLIGTSKADYFIALAVIILATIIYFIPVKDLFKGYLLGILPTLGCNCFDTVEWLYINKSLYFCYFYCNSISFILKLNY